jgi:hypothetical protein
MDKKCVINVAIGGHYPIWQKRLIDSLKNNFDGDILTWTEFPNDNYNKKNPYNCKASAFEEALKRGYTQIIWIDCSAVVKADTKILFDMIKKDGYLTIRNFGHTCAQTCSDKCLEYYNVSRDKADTFIEHASGFIGIDYSHPTGKKLLDMFITGCKEGACDGSRGHNNQSSDPRFLFHRQDQSVLSMAANLLELPPTTDWHKNLITYGRGNGNTIEFLR